MRILYLAHRIPFPPNKGDKIRSFNEIKYLSKNNEIYLLCLVDDPADLKYENELKKYCKSVHTALINPAVAKFKSLCYLLFGRPLSVPYFYSAKIQNKVNSIISSVNIDVIICFSSPMAEYIFRAENYNKTSKAIDSADNVQINRTRAQLIMDFVDVDSDKWRQYSLYTGFLLSWLYRLESKRLSDYEYKIAASFDHSIFVSENEAELFRKQNPYITNVKVVSNGVDSEYFKPYGAGNDISIQSNNKYRNKHSSKGKGPVLLFTGAMDYFANIDGVMWFYNDVFPAIKIKFPDSQFYVVGSRPDKKIKMLNYDDSVVVTGYVEDVREYYDIADLCVIPLRIARGLQNKLLEAMAYGVPVVASAQAFSGIKAIPGRDLEVAEDSKELAAKSIRILGDQSLQEDFRFNGRQVVRNNYMWSVNIRLLEALLGREHMGA